MLKHWLGERKIKKNWKKNNSTEIVASGRKNHEEQRKIRLNSSWREEIQLGCFNVGSYRETLEPKIAGNKKSKVLYKSFSYRT